jgi:hypothetical protein
MAIILPATKAAQHTKISSKKLSPPSAINHTPLLHQTHLILYTQPNITYAQIAKQNASAPTLNEYESHLKQPSSHT